MKYIITESRLERAIIEYLNDNFYPDYGWADTYQKEIDKFGAVEFFINDIDSYIYYGCNYGLEDELHLKNHGCPLLSIYPRISQQLNGLFGDIWKPIFKKWFEENTGLKVNQITDDYI
jgi:hypothetical protein